MASTSSRPIFVFIPGIFHVAAHFEDLLAVLKNRSYDAVALDLPHVGDNPPQATISEQCEFVRGKLRTILDQGHDIVLVAHSVAGLVGGMSVKGLEKKLDQTSTAGIVGVVWITAFIAPEGESGMDMIKAGLFMPPDAAKPEGDHFVYNDKAEEMMYGGEPEDLRRKAVSLLKPQTIDMTSMTVPMQSTCWDIKHLPKTYIFMQQDMTVLYEYQQNTLNHVRKRTNEDGENSSWTLEYMDCGHSPFLSKREELADILVKCAQRSQSAYQIS